MSARRKELVTARLLLADGYPGEAMAICGPILRDSPNDARARYLLAAAYLAVGEAKTARLLLDDLPGRWRDRVTSRMLLSACFTAGGDFETAFHFLKEGLARSQPNASILTMVEGISAERARLKKIIESAKVLLSVEERTGLGQDFAKWYRSVPVFINSYNRLTYLRELIRWLSEKGYRNIAIIDNESTYPPLVEYLRKIDTDFSVYRLERNLGPRALWLSGLLFAVADAVPFVYTDSDVLPIIECPGDVVLHLHELLTLHADISKAGLGIKIDDLPVTYAHRETVRAWESQYWRHKLPGHCYDAPIDTTFALYRPGAWHDISGVRSDYPCLLRHRPWYQDSANLSAEDGYYAEHADKRFTSWSGKEIWSVYSRLAKHRSIRIR